MKQNKKYTIELGGRTLTLDFPGFAEQANGSVIGTYGDTVVHAAVVMSKHDREGMDYFPLTVDYEEKFYAAGKILGSRFVRREGRPSDEAILSARLVDRTLRPLFDHKTRREVQITLTVLAYDEENDPDAIGLIAASAALHASDIPFKGPAAGVRLVSQESELRVNPLMSSLKDGAHPFEMFVAGTGEHISMIEMEGLDAKEGELLKALALAQKEITKITDLQEKIRKEIGKEKTEVFLAETNAALRNDVGSFVKDKLEDAVYTTEKIERQSKMNVLKHEMREHLHGKNYDEIAINTAEELFEDEINDLIHEKVLREEKRPDGRKLDEVRELSSEVGLFARTHGSAIFTRGNTRSLAVVTLGPPGAYKIVETMESTEKKRFMLNYNFPKYSTGETGMSRGPGRREIGHGALAEKSIRRLIPKSEVFPYTIRVVSEIMSSNGSSSMASACSASLALMDAGVPIAKPVAGIAMGIMVENNEQDQKSEVRSPKFKVLTDIQGPEDHHGDMDFKVAGTEDGVNAIQLDVKIKGLTLQMIEKTLEAAKGARLHILESMKKTLGAPRPNLSKYAPLIFTIEINPEYIGSVIGPGGKIINKLIEETGVLSIDIEEDGKVFVTAPTQESGEKARKAIELIVREFVVGDIVEGPVIKILDFGAIVDLGGGKDGMIHVSELKEGFVKNVTDVLRIGDKVRAKVVRVEDGKIGLSIKQLKE